MAHSEKRGNQYFAGFTTGSGKQVIIDPSELEKARLFLRESNDTAISNSTIRCNTVVLFEEKSRETKFPERVNSQHLPAWALYFYHQIQVQQNTLLLCDMDYNSGNGIEEYVNQHAPNIPKTLPVAKKTKYSSSPSKTSSCSSTPKNIKNETPSKNKKRKLLFLQDSESSQNEKATVNSITFVYKSKMSSLANRLLLKEMATLHSFFKISVEYSENACPNAAFTYPHSVLTVTRQNGSFECIHYDIPILMYLVDLANENMPLCDESRANIFSWFGNCNVFNEILFHSKYFKTFYRDVIRHYNALNSSMSQGNFMTDFFNNSQLLVKIANLALSAHLQLAGEKYKEKFIHSLKSDGLNALLKLLNPV